MLTIDEIKNISFRKASLSGGYRAEDVDAFIDEVIATFEQQKKEKNNLVHKIDRLATRLEEYKEDEETVRNALITSQKLSDATMKEANEKAAKIIAEAEAEAAAIVEDANNQVAMQRDTYLSLKSDAVDLRNELLEIYSRHIQNIDDLPTDSEVEESRAMLDEKYSLTADEAPAEQPEPEAAPEPVAEPEPEEEPEEEPAPAPEPEAEPEPAEEPAADEPQPEEEPAPAPKPENFNRVALKRPARFRNLKFGENYDVSDE